MAGTQGNQNPVEMRALRIVVAVVCLLLAVFVALKPDITFAPVPKIVLYLLVSLLPAILFAGEATARFNLSLPVFTATATGAAAIVLITLLVLTHLTKAEEQIAVFRIEDEDGRALKGLQRSGAVEIPRLPNGLSITPIVEDNTIVVIFPEQTPTVDLLVTPVRNGPVYQGKVSYAGNRQTMLKLGRDLKPGG
jgi:hypothetical protein